MDIASLSINLNQYKLMSDVSISLLSKSLDTAETSSANITKMIDAVPAAPVSPAGVGQNIDLYI